MHNPIRAASYAVYLYETVRQLCGLWSEGFEESLGSASPRRGVMCSRLVFRVCLVVCAMVCARSRAPSGPAGHPRGVLCPSGVRPGLASLDHAALRRLFVTLTQTTARQQRSGDLPDCP